MPIRTRHALLPLLLALPLCCLSVQAQQADGLQQRMSGKQFKAAGLDKLTPQELASLDQWVQSHGKSNTHVVDASGKPVFYAGQKKRPTIQTHLVGHFDGWHGNNEMTLDNGQVWRQVGSDAPSCATADHPKVKVKPSLMGNWLMYVSGCNDSAHVRRIR